MKIVTFQNHERAPAESSPGYGVGALVLPEKIVDLTSLVSDGSLSAGQLLECFDLEKGFLERARSAIELNGMPIFRRDAVRLGAPVPRPGKIICIGLNYRDHAEESGMAIPTRPLVFSKFSSCAIGANQPILLPRESSQIDFEAELAFVVGRRAKNVRRGEAMKYVFGYTNFNDVSARDFQFADGQWTRGKSCDTFAPMGEFIATADELEDPHALPIRFRLNGETLQDSNTDQLIFRIPELIEFLSASVTLEPGDVIATGTPPGVGFARKPPVFMKEGDVAEVEIEGLGVLRNPIEAA